MQVRQILAAKGSAVAWVRPDATVVTALEELDRHRVGALVVSPDGEAVAGIVSERDVVRNLARHGSAVLQRSVGEVMTADVQTCGLDDTAEDLMARMTSGRFRHLPVVEDGELVGVVSIGDVVKQRVQELEAEAQSLVEYIRAGA